MKSKVLVFILFIAAIAVQSQNITHIEYFIDQELITGSGHIELVTPGNDITHTCNINTDTLSPGLHNLYFRVYDETGLASPLYNNAIFVSGTTANINLLEYYLDDEIITGSGHTEPITPGNDITHTFNINNLSPGLHNLYFRVYDETGLACPLYNSAIYSSGTLSNINLLEYYLDDELITGSSHQIPITPAAEITTVLDFNTTDVEYGLHTVYFRVRNDEGLWSQMNLQVFYLQPVVHDIVAMEYFLGEDPGFGNGIQIPITTAKEIMLPFDLTLLPKGKHMLQIRAKDSNGDWSLTYSKRIYLLNLKAILQGPYNTTSNTMLNTLNTSGLIPLDQPFDTNPDAVWYYPGIENVPSIPNNQVIDWVLIQTRDAAAPAQANPSTITETKPAFILSDGTIVDISGSSTLLFEEEIDQNMYIVVYHRNHCGIMTANSMPLSGTGAGVWDFTLGSDKYYGGMPGGIQLASGKWGMITGDGNGDGQVSNNDKNETWLLQNGQPGYKETDFNLNGQVDLSDKTTYWKSNSGKGSQVPE
jgi:hypothetical protein